MGPTTSLIAKFSLECVCQWSLTYAFCVLFLFLVLRLCIYIFLFFKKILLFKIYLLRSVFYVRFCLSVGFVHGTYRLFDSKIFTRMCLSVGPNVCVLRPFLFLVLCLCVYVYVFHFFFFKNLFIEKCVLREILSVSGSCARDPLPL